MSEHETCIVVMNRREDPVPRFHFCCSCGLGGVAWYARENAEIDEARHLAARPATGERGGEDKQRG